MGSQPLKHLQGNKFLAKAQLHFLAVEFCFSRSRKGGGIFLPVVGMLLSGYKASLLSTSCNVRFTKCTEAGSALIACLR